MGPSVADKLLESIEEPEKTVIIHMILTNILEPNNANNWLPIQYIFKYCYQRAGFRHIFNGLIWEWYPYNYSINPQEIEKIKNYWTNRISGKINTWENNIEDIFQETAKSDSIKYPCYKVYQNNSNQIRLKDLMELFDCDFSSDKFNNIFTILGNDSTISRSNDYDCHVVLYRMDGLDFSFIHNKLATIFINGDYQGEMPFGLKYTDTKKDVERKIGKPNKSTSFYKQKHVEYTKKRLNIEYDENRQIIKFAIKKKW